VAFVPLGVLLALAVAALLGAGLRVAALAGSVGLERLVGAAVVAAAAAVVEALALGLVGLGSSPVALSLAAGATWLVARRLPAPSPRPRVELAAWWSRLARPWRLLVAVVVAAAAYFVGWILAHPSVSYDSGFYHFPEVASWVQSGHPGSVVSLSYDYPFGSYPLTDEVLMTWGAGIARSWLPAVLWPFAAYGLCGIAAWTGLRTLGATRAMAGLGTLAALTFPWMVHQLNETQNDLPAVTWTVAIAALCAGAPRRPGLLPIGILAAALAIGTKTTPIVVLVVVLGFAVWATREHLRRLAWPLVAAVGVGLVVGGFWYLRDFVDHGSPFWPFARLPGADPMPALIHLTVNEPLTSRLSPTLSGQFGEYADRLAGGILLLAATPIAMAVVRTRAVLVAGATTLVGFVVWARTPGTGLPISDQVFVPHGFALSTTRYLVPVLAAAALTVVLAARNGGRRVRMVAAAVLAGASAWNVGADLDLPSGVLPPAAPLIAVALVLSAILVGLTGFWPDMRRFAATHRAPPWLRAALNGAVGVALAVALMGAVLAPVGDGWVKRSSLSRNTPMIGIGVLRRAASDPAVRPHDAFVFAGWATVGPLAGDRFQHRYTFLPRDASCAQVRAAARKAWLVTTEPGFGHGFFGITPFDANACMRGIKPRFAYKMRLYGPPPTP
jgi:hypothetical protein